MFLILTTEEKGYTHRT